MQIGAFCRGQGHSAASTIAETRLNSNELQRNSLRVAARTGLRAHAKWTAMDDVEVLICKLGRKVGEKSSAEPIAELAE